MKVELRPAVRGDFAELEIESLPYRVRAWTAVRGDEILGIGGLAYLPDGVVAAFVNLAKGAQRYRIALHKAGLHTLAEVRRLGIKRVVALAQHDNPASEPWLARLGFVPMPIDGEIAWIWHSEE